MAEIVTARGEGGWVFEVDLECNPAIRKQIEAGIVQIVDEQGDAAAAGAGLAAAAPAAQDAPADVPAPAPAKPRKPRARRRK